MTNSSFCFEDPADDLETSVEDLFTKRKLSTEDEQLLSSRQIDDIIQVRRGSLTAPPPDVTDDVDEATVAKQPFVAAAATAAVSNRLVLFDYSFYPRLFRSMFVYLLTKHIYNRTVL